MIPCVLLLCLLHAIMAENRLVSVDFEVFGNVQGRSPDT